MCEILRYNILYGIRIDVPTYTLYTAAVTNNIHIKYIFILP